MSNNKKQNAKDQSELFKDSSVEQLREMAVFFGIDESKIAEDATKEQLVELLQAAKRHEVQVAKTIRTPDGKEFTCPPGHMVIKVTPKSGQEWGKKSREIFFFGLQGVSLVGKRGEFVVVPDKYRSCWRDAIRIEYETPLTPGIGPDGELTQPKMTAREVYAEDVLEAHWNRDEEAERAVEEELKANSKKYLEERKAARTLSNAVLQHFGR